MRPWKARWSIASQGASLGFNGATTLRPWKVVTPAAGDKTLPELQWGHDLAAVEGPARTAFSKVGT